jgi:hypothetical protein
MQIFMKTSRRYIEEQVEVSYNINMDRDEIALKFMLLLCGGENSNEAARKAYELADAFLFERARQARAVEAACERPAATVQVPVRELPDEIPF